MSRRIGTALVAAASAGGLGVFVAVRWASLSETLRLEGAWILLPVVVTYAAAATIGPILLRDGIKRWWWVPAALFVLPDAPFESWIGTTSWVATHLGAPGRSVVDLATILAPGAVLALRSDRPAARIGDDRIVPAFIVIAISFLLAIGIGIDGPDASIATALTLLAFGVCSQSSSPPRALIFLVVAVALGADIPGSFAWSAAQGDIGSVAVRDGTVDIAIALLAFSIAPLAKATQFVRVRLAAHAS